MTQKLAHVFAALSTMRTPVGPSRPLLNTAVVVGGSIAGLLAARVLAGHASTVLIVERDQLGSGERRGVPHGLQTHGLLPGGRAQIERWSPGFTEQMVALGAVLSTAAMNASYADGVREVGSKDTVLLASSRPFLEAQIRERTLALHNVRLVTGPASGLHFNADAVTGVRYLIGDIEQQQQADLVVDAMGRASKLSDWLEHAGWERPRQRRAITNVNYATGYYHRQPGDYTITSAIVRNSPGYASASAPVAALNAIENDQWMVMLGGYDEDRPGRDADEFVARCNTGLPAEFGLATRGERVGKIRTYRQADSRRRDFHLAHLPARLVSMGDAVASFNPVYGQGIASAALHGSCLSAYLQSDPSLTKPAQTFFDLQRIIVDAAWQISTAADAARHPPAEPLPARERARRWLIAEIVAAAATDAVVAERFDAVATMLAHPATLATPSVALRALGVNRLNCLKRRIAALASTSVGEGRSAPRLVAALLARGR